MNLLCQILLTYIPPFRENDITGEGNPTELAALDALRAYPGGLQLGGGVNATNAMKYLDAGAAKVIVTSYVFKDDTIQFDLLDDLVQMVGREHLVLDLSCRRRQAGGDYFVVTNKWTKFTDFVVNAENLARLGSRCAEFLVHAVDVEGKQAGIERELVALLGEHSPIPCTYAGGVSSLDDLGAVRSLGQGRVHCTVGSALDIFGGDLPYAEVVQFCTRD